MIFFCVYLTYIPGPLCYVEKFNFFFHWNPYLKTDSANLLILFSANDFNPRIRENAENHNPKDRH